MYKSLQGCRAFAALLVVLHHLGGAIASEKYFGIPMFAEPFRFGDSGVEFFFVLSGFIITWAHARDFGVPSRLTSYMRKRLTRIYPVYWILFLAVYLFAAMSPESRATLPHDLGTLIKSLALVPQDTAIVGGSGAPVLIVAWSLQYEVLFYALAAAFIVNRPLGALLCAGLLVNMGLCHAAACSFPRSFFSNNLLLLFGFGSLLAYGSRGVVRLSRPNLVAVAAASAFGCYAWLETVSGQAAIPVDRRMVYGAVSGVLILALVQAEDAGRPHMGTRWLSLLGDASYSLYLIHFPVISVLCKLMSYLGFYGVAGACIAWCVILLACLVAGLSFHLLIERPMLRAFADNRAAAELKNRVGSLIRRAATR